MAIPANTSVCTLTGTLLSLNGTPISGLKISVEPDPSNPVIQNPLDKTTFPTFDVPGFTDANGKIKSWKTNTDGTRAEIFGMELVFPGDTDLSQRDWNYNVTFTDPATMKKTYLAVKAVSGTVDISSATASRGPIFAQGDLTAYLQAVADARAARDATVAIFDKTTAYIDELKLTGVPGPPGKDGTGIQVAGSVASQSALPTGLGAEDAGKTYVTKDTLDGWTWSGTSWVNVGPLQGPKGDPGDIGPTPTVSATASTLPAGSSATVTKSGTPEAPSFAFGIPKGDKGDKGDQGIQGTTPSISATATTLPAGSTATVTKSGTAAAPSFAFGIPKGDKGDKGDPGDSSNIPPASTTVVGVSRLATADEAAAGTLDTVSVTPAALKAVADAKASATHSHDADDLPEASEVTVGVTRLATSSETSAGALTTAAVSPKNLATELAKKANTAHAHSAADITSGVFASARLPAASTTAAGISRLSTTAEATAGSLATVSVTPAGLKTALDAGLSGKANTSHTHSGADIVSGTISDARLPTASTTTPGTTRLATAAETTAGTLESVAVTPKSLISELSNKAAVSHTHDASNITSGTLSSARLPAASTSVSGISAMATASETADGTVSTKSVTPSSLISKYTITPGVGFTLSGSTAVILAGVKFVQFQAIKSSALTGAGEVVAKIPEALAPAVHSNFLALSSVGGDATPIAVSVGTDGTVKNWTASPNTIITCMIIL